MPSPRCTLVLVRFLSLGNFKKNPLALKAVSLRHKSEAEKTQRRRGQGAAATAWAAWAAAPVATARAWRGQGTAAVAELFCVCRVL